MEDRTLKGYPVYTEDELGAIAQVASGSDCTGLEPTPPMSIGEAVSYSSLENIPQVTNKVDNGFQHIHPEHKKNHK
ncbi:hypothetical protein AAFA46_05385 [Oscillospiraceae bacterium WX1]